jgi:hypothetical protein
MLRDSSFRKGALVKTSIALISPLVLVASLASAKPMPLEAPDPGRGVIGVRVKVIPPAKMGSNSADAVYFVRIVEEGDRFGAESLIHSNYSKGQHVYLLNAKRGRYVAVGCDIDMGAGGGRGSVVFSKADIPQTEIEVQAGSIVFMGEIEAQSSTKTSQADEAQAHYLRLIAPTAANKGFMSRAMSGNYAYTSLFQSVARDEATATAFWGEAVEKHFKNEPEWRSRIAGTH